MARDELSVEHNGPCVCGQGSIEVVCWSPSHSFGRCRWDTNLGCPACRGELEIRQHGADVWLVPRSDLGNAASLARLQSLTFGELARRALAPLSRAMETVARNAGRTLRSWHSIVALPLDTANFEDFRRAVRAAGNFGAWVERQVTPRNAESLAKSFEFVAPELHALLLAHRSAEDLCRQAVVRRIELPAAVR